MSDLQSALQPVLAECRLTERAASRAALRQRCCLRAGLLIFHGKANRYTWNCLSGGATRPSGESLWYKAKVTKLRPIVTVKYIATYPEGNTQELSLPQPITAKRYTMDLACVP